VAVVIPTFNRARVLGTCIRSVARQKLPLPFDIVVVDDGSTDHTWSVVRQVQVEFPNSCIRYVRQENLGANAARNRAVAETAADLICNVDDDVEVPEGWLSHLVEAARAFPDAAAFGGPIYLRVEGREPRHCRADSMPETNLDYGSQLVWDRPLYGANLAFRRTALEDVGGFKVGLRFGDEEEWLMRVLRSGRHILYVPGAWLWHRRTIDELRKSSLLRAAYRRGYDHVPYLLLIGERPTPRGEALVALRGLMHSTLFGCFYGLTRASRALGKRRRLLDAEMVGRADLGEPIVPPK
jgi:glycosyltransferase involved in cell wall biosynthesis